MFLLYCLTLLFYTTCISTRIPDANIVHTADLLLYVYFVEYYVVF